MMWLTVCIVAAGLLVFGVYASCAISSGVYLKAICRFKTNRRSIVLTFDDGPCPRTTPQVLDVLKTYNVRACFFCIGQRAAQYPEIVRRIVAEGHTIGNHSYAHKSCFPLYGKQKMTTDLLAAQHVLQEISGNEIRLFRPPFGVTNPIVGSVVKKLGYTTVGWSLRSLDTQCRTANQALARIKRKLKSGQIILLHDRMPFAAELTEKLLVYLKENQWKVESIDADGAPEYGFVINNQNASEQ